MDRKPVTSVTVRYNDGTKETFQFQQEALGVHIVRPMSDKGGSKGRTRVWTDHEVTWKTAKQEVKGA